MSGRVLALAGGVGGAKLAAGLAAVLLPEDLTVVVNTGDDEVFHGLHVSPDLDTVLYALAGLANPDTGWGVEGDTFHVLETLERLGAETWFRLGDRDLALHLRRTEMLAQGRTLTEATEELAACLGVRQALVPMTDDRVRTVLDTDEGRLAFQDYFVRRRCEPPVRVIRFEGAAEARPSPAFLAAIERADAVVICPSNPFLSIDPLLALPGIRERFQALSVPKVAVSPIIGGQAVKGPLAKLFQELTGVPASAEAIARRYAGLCSHFVLDERDSASLPAVEGAGLRGAATNTLMRTEADRAELARFVLRFVGVKTS